MSLATGVHALLALASLAGCSTTMLPSGDGGHAGQPLIRDADGRITGNIEEKWFGPTYMRAPDGRILGAAEGARGRHRCVSAARMAISCARSIDLDVQVSRAHSSVWSLIAESRWCWTWRAGGTRSIQTLRDARAFGATSFV